MHVISYHSGLFFFISVEVLHYEGGKFEEAYKFYNQIIK